MGSEQRNLVIMFADVPGSATLFERLRDSEALHAVERCLKRMTRSVEGYNGRTLQIGGDELLALFESAEDACHAAIDMQQRITDLPPVSGYKLGIRIGLHAGEVAEAQGKASGEAVRTAARICGTAQRDQILGSAGVLDRLPAQHTLRAERAPNPDALAEAGTTLALHQIFWPAPTPGGNPQDTAVPVLLAEPLPSDAAAAPPSDPFERLCVRYHGKAFLLDSKTPLLTIGRDQSNKMVVDDPKASRQHARIEKRGDGYYLVDTSTNGTFVALAGQRESIQRRSEMALTANGRIAFGTSSNDPKAEVADFEYL